MSAGVAVVTGGGRGVGKTITRALSEMGYVVHICARTTSELAETAREIPHVVPQRVDVMNRRATRRWVAGIIRREPSIDVLVNNVGIMAAVGPFVALDMDAWEAVFDCNLFAVARITHQVLPVMIKQRRGCIINLAGGGSAYPRKRFSAYACSKAAVLRFSDTLAEELWESGIRVNAITPGSQQSAIWHYALKAGEQPPKQWADPEALMKLVRYVVSSPVLKGKFLHVEDDYERIDEQVMASELYTLRRISPSGRSVIPPPTDGPQGPALRAEPPSAATAGGVIIPSEGSRV